MSIFSLPAPIPPVPREVLENIIGYPGPPPRLPQPPPRTLNMEADADREAYYAYEASREYETWQTGEVYVPTPPGLLYISRSEIYLKGEINAKRNLHSKAQ